jgi:enoyl-CoA hydratase/carnithine racemase
MFKTLRYEAHDGVGILTLDRPKAKNAIDIPMRTEMRELVENLRYDRSLRTLVITGAGGNFCSGGDLNALGDVPPAADLRRQRLVDLAPLVHALLRFDCPVISAVQGVAFGGGLGLALTADLVIAADDARFCAAFGRVGTVPDFGSLYTLPRFVGVQRAKELLFSAREFDAREAHRLGMVLEVQPAAGVLDRAVAVARSLAGASHVALSLTKRAVNVSLMSSLETMLMLEADGQGIAMSTDYHGAAVRRFLDKKGPMFSWPAGGT